MRLIILTGISGAGKMTALQFLEDIGYHTVDNLPPSLLLGLAHAVQGAGCKHCVVVVDARSGAPASDLPAAVDDLSKEGFATELLYLDAGNEMLVRRFKETRRPHPLFGEGNGTIIDAIMAERRLLEGARERADKLIDTSNLSPSDLKTALTDFAATDTLGAMHITVESFGFKHGVPIDADLVFDVRFLINPHYVPELQPLTGISPDVAKYIHAHPLTGPFLEKLFDFIAFSLPHYKREGKAYLTIAIGCTGGRHRSVAVAEDLAEYLIAEGYSATIYHRDLRFESVHGV